MRVHPHSGEANVVGLELVPSLGSRYHQLPGVHPPVQQLSITAAYIERRGFDVQTLLE